MLDRIAAGVKAVGLVAVLGAIALAAVAQHRGDGAAPVAAAAVGASPAQSNATPSGASLPDYLRQAANAAAELPPED